MVVRQDLRGDQNHGMKDGKEQAQPGQAESWVGHQRNETWLGSSCPNWSNDRGRIRDKEYGIVV